ncbi:MAG: Fur family transcriptional regulator [Candidatus Saccharimonadales bacterium]
MNPAKTQDEAFIALLKDRGERVTAPRLAVFRLLSRFGPLPMSKLSARAKDDGIDTVTVYRTIALFRELGLVREIGVGSRRLLELTDDFCGHHHHFWCSRCGQITDFDDSRLEAAMIAAGRGLGIKVLSHQVEITGLCGRCAVV